MRKIYVKLLLAWLALVSIPVRAIELDQAANLARLSTVFLWVDYIDCDTKVAAKASATGFIVSNDGHVVTAAHTFRSTNSGCEHSVRSITGAIVRETAPVNATDADKKLSLHSKDFDLDLASLRFDSGLPKGARAHWVCSEKSPQAGETLYAFGYPEGKPLTPLSITFSKVDVKTGFWIVSGLTTFGMSGGPVFDRFGNIVGSVQGGLATEKEQVLAVRYVAPLSAVYRILSEAPFLKNCGLFPVKPIASATDDLRVILTDKVICGAGVVSGFVAERKKGGSSLLILPDSSQISANSAGLEASRFRVEIRKISITQHGVDAPEFDRTRDILGCLAASQWLDQPGRDLFEAQDFRHIEAIQTLLEIGGEAKALTYDECLLKSSLRASGLGDLAIESSVRVSMAEDEVGPQFVRVGFQNLDFASTNSEYRGSLLYLAAENKIQELVGEAKGDALSKRLAEIFRGKSAHRVAGIHVACKAYNNIRYNDFKRVCASVAERAIYRGGNDTGSCLTPVSY